ncbi:Pyrophosphate-energized proton pump [Spirochaeta thermophila DSM 6578]|uniref:Putative K(+)-stimulated pyrophosphate-energized sodium pump n=1 Tax=Winmispira thermophila (strain ATCC 700085 / DSM 6578 / Z-1203) TaxID=869211 RepID=G0GF02_WINT7|nr:sodium-translocating pyrophosphatase [Spirochaeta thermophila]AEJ62346.1 Pyrophosphate-energized proton pump [Spirochaeta thermophila DSM 6578]
MQDQLLLLFPLGAGLAALVVAFFRYFWIKKQETGADRLQEIAAAIRAGAMAFLAREYKVIVLFAAAVTMVLVLGEQGYERLVAVSFLVGALMSALAGFVGMRAATQANVRTAHAAERGLVPALTVAFNGGSVMGLSVVGFGILGLSALFLVYSRVFGSEVQVLNGLVIPIISGYSMGASSIALFARVGGGIFTKGADVGADLVGKVEAGIPEDDPRNPAVIADNVGDNVGDVAGLGSDLCESYIGAIIGSVVLGGALGSFRLAILPLLIAGVGIIASIIGTFFVRTREGGHPQKALNLGSFVAAGLMLLFTYPAVFWILSPEQGLVVTPLGLFLAVLSGLVAGVLVGIITEYYTGDGKKPVLAVARSSHTGTATNIIAGIEVGMQSTGLPVIVLGLATYLAYLAAGLYGIAIAAVGMLSTVGYQVSVDAYGPIADNAGGLAEMAKLDPEVRMRTDKLDAVGNTTAAIGKGFAIGSATFTALSLFVAYEEAAGLPGIDITQPKVIVGVLMGAMLPYVFSSFVIGAVGRAAFAMIEEVRRQFRSIKGLLEGKEKPDYVACVDIATKAAIREMIIPGLSAVVIPPLVGYLGGAEMLGGLLVGAMVSAVMLALFMANAGGAWDNAKKYIEGGAYGGKGSESHKAAVVGDTVGDPFKDTAGPAMDIVIKLMSVVSLVIAPNLR